MSSHSSMTLLGEESHRATAQTAPSRSITTKRTFGDLPNVFAALNMNKDPRHDSHNSPDAAKEASASLESDTDALLEPINELPTSRFSSTTTLNARSSTEDLDDLALCRQKPIPNTFVVHASPAPEDEPISLHRMTSIERENQKSIQGAFDRAHAIGLFSDSSRAGLHFSTRKYRQSSPEKREKASAKYRAKVLKAQKARDAEFTKNSRRRSKSW